MRKGAGMSKRMNWVLVLGVAAVLTVVNVCATWMRAADAAKAEEAGLLYELRIYTAAPGKMEALNKRFRDHTLRMFEKHGIKNIGYWTAVDEQHQGKL